MEKSRDAFRTISEVAGWLDVPTHVLRFWESRFSQIKPVKRAGGRRYYRPSDMSLIGGIKTLLHDQGMTIRGVQKMLREQGIKHVSSFSPPLHGDDDGATDDAVIEGTAVAIEADAPAATIPSPAARVTREAEPVPEEPAPSVSAEEADDGQPDMFPETESDVATEDAAAPMFSHREMAPSSADEATTPPAPAAPLIPATPDVPDVDPEDDDPTRKADPGLASILRGMSSADLAGKEAALRPAVDRLKRLRERMAE